MTSTALPLSRVGRPVEAGLVARFRSARVFVASSEAPRPWSSRGLDVLGSHPVIVLAAIVLALCVLGGES